MRKILTLLAATVASLALAGQVYAASPMLDIRIQQPKSPTNINNLKVNFVVLDRRVDRQATVQCYKKGPSDAGFSPFGSPITLKEGGNTDNCEPSTVLSTEGTFQFYAVATAGSDSATSPTVTVDYKTSGPGTPTNYSKELATCTYKIKVRTADDAGKTARVDLYRSADTSFSADVAHRVDQRFVGSNTDVEILNSVPDCAKTYYYAVRAFDSVGNGSGIVGDSIIVVTSSSTTTTTTTTSTTTSANTGTSGSTGAVAGGTNGNVLGETVQQTGAGETTSTTEQGTVKGESTESAEPTTTEADQPASTNTGMPWWLIAAGIGGILLVAWLLLKRKKTNTLA